METQKLSCPVKRLRTHIVQRVQDAPIMESINYLKPVRMDCVFDEQRATIFKHKTFQIPSNVKYISDYFFDLDDYEYIDGRCVMISSGTGSGKTTLMTQLAHKSRASILIVSNRIGNVEQIKLALGEQLLKGKRIVLQSYQALEKNEHLTSSWVNEFDFVFMDESHYFLQDSSFNSDVNLSWEKLMNARKPVKFFMSATNEDLAPYLIGKLLIDYKDARAARDRFINFQMKNHNSKIRRLIGFENIQSILGEILYGEGKSMIFVKSIEQGESLLKLIKEVDSKIDVAFIYSDGVNSKKNTKQAVVFKKMIQESKFDQKALICTSLCDNGLSLKDDALRRIIILDNDPVEIIQELGRKRAVSSEDWFDVYLIEDTYKSLASTQTQLEKKHKVFNETNFLLEYEGKVKKPVYLTGKENDVYRQALYFNEYNQQLYPNKLGIANLKAKRQWMDRLVNSPSSFAEKVSVILGTLPYVPEIVLPSATETLAFIRALDSFLNVKIMKNDDSSDKLFRLMFGKVHMAQYGLESTAEKKGRPFSWKLIHEKIAQRNIPIRYVDYDDYYILESDLATKKDVVIRLEGNSCETTI